MRVGVDPTGRRVAHMSVNPASEYRYDMSGENLPVGEAGKCRCGFCLALERAKLNR